VHAQHGEAAKARATVEESLSRIDEGGEDEGDEAALAVVLRACATLNEGVLAERARRAARRRFEARAESIEDPGLRASVRALARSVAG
jgi:hypothetical protein